MKGFISSNETADQIKRELSGQTTTSNKQNKDEEIKETYQVKSIDKKQDIVYTLSNKSYPIINISGSPEVDNINEEMKQNYVDKDDEYCSSEYNYYLNNEILSIIITQYTSSSYYYEVYNVNVSTGKVVSNTDLLKSKNVDETAFISTLKECCKSKFLEEHTKCPRNGKRTRIYGRI